MIPEDLQVKLENVSPPLAGAHLNTIKERLNHHVKKRQQQQGLPFPYIPSDQSFSDSDRITEEKEILKTKRPYQRRTEKATAMDVNCPMRKRGKSKQIAMVNSGPSAAKEPHQEDEADTSFETESRPFNVRSPDVLSMVLSVKKEALLRDPEVNEFLNQMIEAIKD